MDYAKEIQSIAKKNISKGYDVGDHSLFGFSIEVSSIKDREYELETIVQVNVTDDGRFPAIYLLPYYWANKDNGWCDHDDIDFYDLNETDKVKIYKAFKEFVGNEPTDKMGKA